MAQNRTSTWKKALAIAGIVLVIGLLVSGYIIWGLAILVLALALGGGALLYRTQGPPRQ